MEIESGATPIATPVPKQVEPAKKRSRRPLAVLLGTLVLVLAVWRMLPGDNAPVRAEPEGFIDSVAVLPVENLTGDASFDLVADAVTYDVIHELSRMKGLKVTSLQSVRALANANLRPLELGDSLDVRLILTTSFRAAGNSVRIGEELIDGVTDNSVWTQRWDLDANDKTEFEEAVVWQLVEGIVETADVFDGFAGELEMRYGPGYQSYLLGLESLGQRTPAGINQAIVRFREAISLDHRFAPAYASLSTAYTLALIYRYNIGMDGYEIAGQALASANRAIELDSSLAAGYGARGLLASRSLGPTNQAAIDFRRALELQPNAPEQPSWYATILVQEGRTVEALASAERGVSLAPYSPARHLALAMVGLELKRFDLAQREAHRVTELEPQITVSRALEGQALLLAGRADECIELEFGPHEAVRAACLYYLGRKDEAAAIIDSVTSAIEQGGTSDPLYTDVTRLADLAGYYAWIGDDASMYLWLERAFEVSPMGVWSRVLSTDLFKTLHDNPVTARQLELLRVRVWRRVQQASRSADLP